MKKIRKILGLVIITGIILAGIGGFNLAQAAKTDTFTITVTCNFLSILLRDTTDASDYTVWDLGQLAESASASMADASGVFLSRGSTNVAIDVQTKVTEPNDWTVTTGAVGVDTYRLVVSGTTAAAAPDFSPAVSVYTSGLDVITNLASNDSARYLYYKFWGPTETSVGTEQSIVVTVEVMAS